MRRVGRSIFGLVAFGILSLFATVATAEEGAVDTRVVVEYYWGEGCPLCERHDVFLADVLARYPNLEIRRYEVKTNAAHRQRLLRILNAHGVVQAGIPVTVIQGKLWVGHSERITAEIDDALSQHLDPELPADPRPSTRREVTIPLFGEVDVSTRSMFVATLIIAFADGFNPCSLWVLTVLLAMVLRTGSRRRVAAVGLVFLSTTAAVYGLFIAGVFTVLLYLEQLPWIQIVVALFALIFGVVNIKDYFAYKRGISFTIPERFKPGIMRQTGKLRSSQRSLGATLLLTVAMALGIALIELPCTAGFPVVWSSLLSTHGVEGAGFASLLAVYLVVYLSVEIAILVGVLVTFRLDRLEERQGRVLKLIGGAIMLALGGVLFINPAIMTTMTGSLATVGGAVTGALLVMGVERLVKGASPPGQNST